MTKKQLPIKQEFRKFLLAHATTEATLAPPIFRTRWVSDRNKFEREIEGLIELGCRPAALLRSVQFSKLECEPQLPSERDTRKLTQTLRSAAADLLQKSQQPLIWDVLATRFKESLPFAIAPTGHLITDLETELRTMGQAVDLMCWWANVLDDYSAPDTTIIPKFLRLAPALYIDLVLSYSKLNHRAPDWQLEFLGNRKIKAAFTPPRTSIVGTNPWTLAAALCETFGCAVKMTALKKDVRHVYSSDSHFAAGLLQHLALCHANSKLTKMSWRKFWSQQSVNLEELG